MGYKSRKIDDSTNSLLKKAQELLIPVLNPRHILEDYHSEYDLLIGEDIKNHLENCGKILMFAATLGTETDKLISKINVTNVALAFCLDAMSSAAIEKYADEITDNLPQKHTSRFSPGYGDLPLETQPLFLKTIKADKKIGLFCTETLILTPRKSITAFVGTI